MRLLQLTLSGFKSFAEPAQFKFDRTPGLYYITGRNMVEPELGANGAGKSTLFEAVYWALRGATSEGVRAGDIRTWQTKKPCIVDLTIGGAQQAVFVVHRQAGPNILELRDTLSDQPEPVDQPSLEQAIECTPDVFLHSAYFAQHAELFVDLGASEQTALFSQVLGLDQWDEAADRASKANTLITQEQQNLLVDQSKLMGQAEELACVDYVERERVWAADQRVLVSGAALAVKQIEASYARALVTREDARAGGLEFRRRRETLNKHELDLRIADQKVRELEKQLSALRSKNIKECPTCGQPVDSTHIAKEVIKVTKAYKEAESSAQAFLDVHVQLIKEMAEFGKAETVLLDAEKDVTRLEGDLYRLKQAMGEAKTAQNPHTAARHHADKRGAELVGQLDVMEARIAAMGRDLAAVVYWQRAFKEIRLSLIKESLAQLMVEANETLFALGLRDWSIEFEVEKETKSGTVRKAFNTLIRSPHTDKPVPWEAWSGGERQRLRLAITMGFANLVASRQSTQCNVELYDEPTSGLNQDGITALLTVLSERAQRLGKAIYIADHRSLEFGGFAGTFTVVKDEKGSRIDQS